MSRKEAIVIHSGGWDSTLCLALAKRTHGKEAVLSMSFTYGQRHQSEVAQAARICRDWEIDHVIIPLDCIKSLTQNALTDEKMAIEHTGSHANTLVVGRNGLFVRLAAMHAYDLGVHLVYSGVLAADGEKNGYRDCSRDYMDRMEEILQIDLDDPSFRVVTPLVSYSKNETVGLALSLGILNYLKRETISCYEGIGGRGCEKCPSCLLRNAAIDSFAL